MEVNEYNFDEEFELWTYRYVCDVKIKPKHKNNIHCYKNFFEWSNYVRDKYFNVSQESLHNFYRFLLMKRRFAKSTNNAFKSIFIPLLFVFLGWMIGSVNLTLRIILGCFIFLCLIYVLVGDNTKADLRYYMYVDYMEIIEQMINEKRNNMKK